MKHPPLPPHRAPVELNACSLHCSGECSYYWEQLLTHAWTLTDESTAEEHSVPKRFHSRTNVAQVTACKIYFKLQVNGAKKAETTEPDHTPCLEDANTSFTLPHLKLHTIFLPKSNTQSSNAPYSTRVLCRRWNVTSVIRLITVVNADRKILRVLSLQPITSVNWTGPEPTASCKTHFTFCLDRLEVQ